MFGSGHTHTNQLVPYVLPPEDLAIPLAERIALGDLDSVHCRWPLGDPKQDGFGFCGRPALRGKPYCDHHTARSCRGTRE